MGKLRSSGSSITLLHSVWDCIWDFLENIQTKRAVLYKSFPVAAGSGGPARPGVRPVTLVRNTRAETRKKRRNNFAPGNFLDPKPKRFARVASASWVLGYKDECQSLLVLPDTLLFRNNFAAQNSAAESNIVCLIFNPPIRSRPAGWIFPYSRP